MIGKRKIIISVICTAALLCGGCQAAGGVGGAGGSADITLDFSKVTGDIKPLNGINNGPASHAVWADDGSVSFDFDVTGYYKAMNIPIVRLHDSEYPFGSDKFVDIHCIFPDFSADVDDPASYYFEATDAYIARMIEAGCEVMFRLGESIDHTGENRYTNPPADYDKWAQVCDHIVRHYNERWNNGYSYGIKYWEIWNETDTPQMWTGTYEDYCRLYATTAKYLKERHPDIYVGGPAFTSVKETTTYDFLDGIREYGDVPLDFYSWHAYNSSAAAFAPFADKARQILDEYGYTDTLSILDEWNYAENWDDQTSSIEVRNSVKGAAYTAAALMTMQDHKVDMAMYYDGQYEFADLYCGLYGKDGQTKPSYYSFKYWGELVRLGTRTAAWVETSAGFEEDAMLKAVAAKSASGLRGMMIVNYSSLKTRVSLDMADHRAVESVEIRRVNDKYPDEKVSSSFILFGRKTITMQPGEVLYITF